MMIIKLNKKVECKRCFHNWTPRKENVRCCPNCHSAWWDLPFQRKLNKIGDVNGFEDISKQSS